MFVVMITFYIIRYKIKVSLFSLLMFFSFSFCSLYVWFSIG